MKSLFSVFIFLGFLKANCQNYFQNNALLFKKVNTLVITRAFEKMRIEISGDISTLLENKSNFEYDGIHDDFIRIYPFDEIQHEDWYFEFYERYCKSNAINASGPFKIKFQYVKFSERNYTTIEFNFFCYLEDGNLKENSFYNLNGLVIEEGKIIKFKQKKQGDLVDKAFDVFKKREVFSKQVTLKNDDTKKEISIVGNVSNGKLLEVTPNPKNEYEKPDFYQVFTNKLKAFAADHSLKKAALIAEENVRQLQSLYDKNTFVGCIGNCQDGYGKKGTKYKDTYYKIEGNFSNGTLNGRGKIFCDYTGYMEGWFINGIYVARKEFGGMDSSKQIYIIANQGKAKMYIPFIYPIHGISSELHELFKVRDFSSFNVTSINWTGKVINGKADGVGKILVSYINADNKKEVKEQFDGIFKNGLLWEGNFKGEGDNFFGWDYHYYAQGQYVHTKHLEK